ncbi:DUF2490 domain-containing protein [Erythrobacter sp. WG]|uniref:DUF2490 domain-containing protein n=1 Tax=Erythrobacter sp. WG TaxID=2985510 RepID=UPI002270E1A7|nr:DUF2490 domain-containing protein [Erythrobacter sp. WG]MCX9146330.1 DUF2490 domain-containing protein [Erythrobacter sp. WG]
MLLAALAAAWQPSKAWAAEEDTQFWLNAFATGKIAEKTTLTIDATQRWRSDQETGADQQTIRVMAEQQVAERTRIGGGVMLFDTAGLTEIRLHQQAIFTIGRIEARTRLEERFFDGADRMELRLRQRVTYNQPIATEWRASAGVEWLGIMQSRRADQGASTEQWRLQASVTHRLSKYFDVGAIYWHVIFPRGPRPAQTSHIPQLALTYRF